MSYARDSVGSSSSHRLILEHVLSYPGSYELPLRTMYTLNCISRAQPLPQTTSGCSTPPSSVSQSPTSPAVVEFPSTQIATAQFTCSLFNQIARLPSQPCSLPPVFINSFLRRCFPPDLALVDFPQALTALDYLKDLETRRRRELASAFARLGVVEKGKPTNAANPPDLYHPTVISWAEAMEKNDNKIEALYTQLYVALRRWILINELSLTPFNKHNSLAMLNTLYPPTSTSRPTTKLTVEVLKRQRDIFFKYVRAVERKGVDVLKPLMAQNTHPGDENGWPRVRSILDNYLRVAISLIDDCGQITNVDELIRLDNGLQGWSRRQDKKTDSGVSFVSDLSSRISSFDDRKRYGDMELDKETPRAKKRYSTLERIALELKKFRARTKSQIPLRNADAEKEPEKGRENIEDRGNIQALHDSNDSVINRTAFHMEGARPRASSTMIRKFRSLGDLKSLTRTQSMMSRSRGLQSILANDSETLKEGRSLGERIVVVPGASHSFG